MDEKNTSKRALITTLVIVVFLLMALFLSKGGDESVTVSSPNDTYAKVGDSKITNEDIYEFMLENYGVNVMSNDIDKNVFKTYIEQAKNDSEFNIQDEYEKTIYNGKTLAEAKEAYTAEQLDEYEISFNQTLILNNYTEETYKDQLYLLHAKELYASDAVFIKYETEDYVTVEDIMTYYDAQNDSTFVDTFFLSTKTEEETTTIKGLNAYGYVCEQNQDLFDTTVIEYLDNKADTDYYTLASDHLNDIDLAIYDTTLGYSYKADNSDFVVSDPEGSLLYSYSVDGTKYEVTVDDFFDTLKTTIGSIAYENYSSYTLVMLDQDLVDEVITDTVSTNIQSTIQNYKSNFTSGSYTSYGFDPDTMTYSEFLLTALNATSELDFYNDAVKSIVMQQYLLQNLREANAEYCYQLMKDTYYDAYPEGAYSLTAVHLLAYVDNDKDDNPDSAGTDLWTDEQNILAQELLSSIIEDMNSTDDYDFATFDTIVEAYNNATIDDATYGKYIAAGILLKTETFAATQTGLVESFSDAELAIYEEMLANGTNKGYSKDVIETVYGYHIVCGTDPVLPDDAYPDDEDKLFPTEDVIDMYYDDNDSITDETLSSFIETYYVTPVETYIDANSPVYLANAKIKLGEVLPENNTIAEIRAVNKAILEATK